MSHRRNDVGYSNGPAQSKIFVSARAKTNRAVLARKYSINLRRIDGGWRAYTFTPIFLETNAERQILAIEKLIVKIRFQNSKQRTVDANLSKLMSMRKNHELRS